LSLDEVRTPQPQNILAELNHPSMTAASAPLRVNPF
jgi:hypothetical protein